MRSNRIVHPALAGALATLGHTDLVLVTDAGFPIPAGANRIDLGFIEGVPDVREVLRALRRETFFEEVGFAPELKSHYPSLYAEVQEIFTGSGAVFSPISHEELCDSYAHRAKVIVRSGSFEPWANFAMVASTDPFAWFADQEKVRILDAYVERRRRITENEVPDLP